ncbi:tRNAHis guanylyltransferase-domain-containing protein, partial [Mortierella sp. GBAus27b]
MAKSKYEYVKEFETDDKLLRNVYILVRIDGKGFHKFSAAHQFHKPNDIRALNLMNHAARCVMHELDDILLAFGESDEYSFLFRKSTDLYQRREAKIVTTVVSLFTSAYVYYWRDYFPDQDRPLYPPVFDGRAVLYPSDVEVKDYFAWRQADTHINNLYNTSFWALVEKGGLTPKAAEKRLSGTDSKDKNEMLFTEFNTNYSKLPAIYRKGSVLLRENVPK